jgi:hypothetical protein
MAALQKPLPWQPTRLEELADGPFDTSMGTAKVKTDATYGFLKAMGNRQGPHALACEWVGTSLARWFGLTVPDFAILRLEEEECYALPARPPEKKGPRTQSGPAFISREFPGRTWGTSVDELDKLENRTDITRLVVFDNWVRNCDRHPPDLSVRKPNYANVFLADADGGKRYRLYAIDHSHCFDRLPELTRRMAEIDRVKDDGVYGLFPAFQGFIDPGELAWCKAMLHSLDVPWVRQLVSSIPREWDVGDEARAVLVEFILKRAQYLVDKLDKGWGVAGW